MVGITDCRQNNRSRLVPPTLPELQRLRDELMQQPRVMPVVEPRQRRTSRRLVNRFPSATRRQIVDAYRAGATAAQLAQEHGVSKGGMISLLRAEGAKIRRQPIPSATVQQAVQLYESGATIAELAKRFGVAHNTLRLRLIDAGVVMRGRGGRRVASHLRGARSWIPA